MLNRAVLLPTIQQVVKAMREWHNAGPIVIDTKLRMVRVPMQLVG